MARNLISLVAACTLATVAGLGTNLLRKEHGDEAFGDPVEQHPVGVSERSRGENSSHHMLRVHNAGGSAAVELAQIVSEGNEGAGKGKVNIGAEGSLVSARELGLCKVPKHGENVWGSIFGARERICDGSPEVLQQGDSCETACARWYKIPSPPRVWCSCDPQGYACTLQPVTVTADDAPVMMSYLRCPISFFRVFAVLSCFGCLCCGLPAVMFASTMNQRKRRQQSMDEEKAKAPVLTSLTEYTFSGSTLLKVASQEGFRVGSTIKISDANNSEINTIAAFGSLILSAPLVHSYAPGATVLQMTATPPQAPVKLPPSSSKSPPQEQPAQGEGASEDGEEGVCSPDQRSAIFLDAVAVAMNLTREEIEKIDIDGDRTSSVDLEEDIANEKQTGEDLLQRLPTPERDELFKLVAVDQKLNLMKPSSRLLIAYSLRLVRSHVSVETKDIRLPAKQKIWNFMNSCENATAGVVIPLSDEQRSNAARDNRQVSDMDQISLAAFSFLPIVDWRDDRLRFGSVEEGIVFAQKLLGPVLPKPSYAWDELWSDQAQADIAYFGIGQLYLKPSDDSNYEHMVDMRSMESLAVRSAYEKYGAAAYFREGNLMGIERGGTFFKSSSSEWNHVKFAWRSSLFTWVTVVDHLVITHLVVSNGINAASREMPPVHPVRRVLHVSIFGASTINSLANATLVNKGGFLHRISALKWKGGLSDVVGSAKNFKFETWPQKFDACTLPHDVKKNLPLFKHGLAVWEALHKFYSRYVDAFYENDEAALRDDALVNYWRFRCTPQYTQGLPALSKSALANQLTHACFYATAFHEIAGEVVQYLTTPRGMFFQIRPGEDMADAEQLANALALSASTGRFMPKLMSDWSHLLDPTQEVQSAYQALMDDLQQVSKKIQGWNKESRIPFRELDPVNFECSVSL